jgi:hypothetical protein
MKTELLAKANQSVTQLNVLVAYDRPTSGQNAKELCDRLERAIGPAYELIPSFWNIEALQDSLLAQATVAEAVSAAFLVLAVDANQHLPPAVRSWVARCACRMHARGGALVAQLHGILKMEKETSPAYTFLKEVAHDAGMDFFSEVVEPADSALDYSMESIHQRACMRTTVLDSILRLVGNDELALIPLDFN